MGLRPKLDEKDEWSKHRVHPAIRVYESRIEETQLLICIDVDVYVAGGIIRFDDWSRCTRDRKNALEPFPTQNTSNPPENIV